MSEQISAIGYAHARPPFPTQPKKLATIRERWESVWAPRCLLAAKREDDPADAFCVFHHAYKRRIDTLLRAGISWDVICRSDLDSPIQSGTEFDRALCLAIERRRCRMGRIKGKTKIKGRTHAGGK